MVLPNLGTFYSCCTCKVMNIIRVIHFIHVIENEHVVRDSMFLYHAGMKQNCNQAQNLIHDINTCSHTYIRY